MSAQLARSVLVTGGNQGIGLGIAQRLAAAGHRVAVTHHASPAPQDLMSVKCDVADRESVAEAVAAAAAEHGPVEMLVYAAGITRDGLMLRMADRDWDDVIETDLGEAGQRPARCCRPWRGGGSVGCCSSAASSG